MSTNPVLSRLCRCYLTHQLSFATPPGSNQADHGSAATGELVVLGEDAETKGESPTLAASDAGRQLARDDAMGPPKGLNDPDTTRSTKSKRMDPVGNHAFMWVCMK